MRKPKVSVVLPVYNGEKYLAEAIESILNQTFSDFELIIIDDHSTDSTPTIIAGFRKIEKRIVFLQNKKNLKLSKTLNVGIKAAKGEYIARMDADDWSYPQRLEKQVAFLDKHPEVGIVGGFMKIMDSFGKVVSERTYALSDEEIRNKIYYFSPFSHPAIMIRKAVLDQVGGYNHRFNPAEDYELYFRIGEVSSFANISAYLLKYRVVPNSMTTGAVRKMEEKTLEVRMKNFQNPLYKPTFFAYVYTYLEKISLFVVPDNIKLRLFNSLRDVKMKEEFSV